MWLGIKAVIKISHLRQMDSVFSVDFSLVSFSRFGKIFQNLKVSSPAPVTIVVPYGFIARYSTLYVCPVKVSIFSILGIFQMLISLREYPWVLTNSLTVRANMRLQT